MLLRLRRPAAFLLFKAINLLQAKVLFFVIFIAKHVLFDGVLHVRNKRVGSLERDFFACYDAFEQLGNALPNSGADTGPACHGMCAGRNRVSTDVHTTNAGGRPVRQADQTSPTLVV